MSVGIRRPLSVGLVSLCVLVGGLVFASVPALAVGPEAPTIMSESVANVEATAATLEAEINPGGAETTYRFEYDTSEAYGQSTPESASIGEDEAAHLVTARITGLEPGTTYHYRVVATNSLSLAGGTPGAGKTLTTTVPPGSGSSGSCPNEQLRAEQPYGLELPDCRAYELVSPLEKNGNDATEAEASTSDGSFVSRAAVSGEAIEYQSQAAFADPAGNTVADEFLSRRGPGGWSTQSITPPIEGYGVDLETAYEAMVFTPELTKGVTETDALSSSEAPAGFWELYLADFANSSYQWVSKNGPAGARGTPYQGGTEVRETKDYIAGASTDLSHVVIYHYGGLIYEWVEGIGGLIHVDIANSGEAMAGEPGSSGLHNLYEVEAWHAVSSDASRIFFTSEGQVYVRENAEREQSPVEAGRCTMSADACTVEVSASQKTNGTGPGGADPNGPQSARYWGASVEGSKVFFTSTAELTDDAYTGAADNTANLYEYDLQTGKLTDLTVDTADVAEGAAVQGVVQISEDGSYVYFVAQGVLAGENADGRAPVAGQPNLYVSHEGGAPTFIATLAEGFLDAGDWATSSNGYVGGPNDSTAVVTPDGTRLAFLSHRSLTGYDNTISTGTSCGRNHNVAGGLEPAACTEVFEYDSVTGRLACVSCDPTGARPTGPSNLEWSSGGSYIKYRARNFTEDGALFFQSSDGLVPHAIDDRQNVYEYENGHIYAISDVAGDQEAFFMDASPNGDDVFFGTADQLVAQDRDNRVDVYDARMDGGFPASVSVAPCDNGDSCKPPTSPQPAVFGAPASATFSGTGNVVPPPPVVKPKPQKKTVKCGVGKRLSHGRCVKSGHGKMKKPAKGRK